MKNSLEELMLMCFLLGYYNDYYGFMDLLFELERKKI